MSFGHRLTRGHVLRHVPPASSIGVDVALLDIAQDFILTHLHREGFFGLAVFKGGTALRKLFAGSSGRFSTDIDLAIASADEDGALSPRSPPSSSPAHNLGRSGSPHR